MNKRHFQSFLLGGCLAILSEAVANDFIAQQAYLKASNTNAGDQFGWSVAADGDIMVIGAPSKGGSTGAAYVFQRRGDLWKQHSYLQASNPETGDHFGNSVAIHGDTIVIGAFGEDSSASGVNGDQSDNRMESTGAVYVFERADDQWIQQAYLKASNPGPVNNFGISVGIHENTIVVGAENEDTTVSNSGAAYVFARRGDTWQEQALLKADDPGDHDQFGWSVAVDGHTIVVGAYLESTVSKGVDQIRWGKDLSASGAAYVFVRDGEAWSQQAYLKASNAARSDGFGATVAISGDTIVVGAPLESSKATGVNGSQRNDLQECGDADDPFADPFAGPFASECDSINDHLAIQSGAAYVFHRVGDKWTQQAYLKASNTGEGDTFGNAVGISRDFVVVGARSESGGTTGINGDQADDSRLSAGAAYLFQRSGETWGQKAYLKASNTERSDSFGESVAISSDTVVIASTREASKATGVDGDQSDNSFEDAGAVYIFQDTQPEATFAKWLETNGLSDPLADPEGNGWNHLLTYAFGADLTENPNDALPSISLLDVDGTRSQTISFRKRIGADTAYRIEISETLEPGNWRVAGVDVEPTGEPIDNKDGTVTETFRVVDSPRMEKTTFMRVVVNAP